MAGRCLQDTSGGRSQPRGKLRESRSLSSPAWRRQEGRRGMEVFKPTAGMRKGKLQLVHQNLACWGSRAPLERK